MPGFDERFDGLSLLAFRVAYRLLGDRAEAEDVAQEALARAYVRWPRVDPYAEPWVSRVATNLALDRVRKAKTRDGYAPSAPAATDPYADERVDLVRALRALPRRQRDVVAMRYLADQAEEYVAAALGCSVGTVKTHASRGLAALRAALGERG